MAQKWIAIGRAFLGKTLDILHFSRCVTWYFASTKEYTKSAFMKKSETFKSFEDADMRGKTFMILGATGSVGTAVAEYIVKKDGITLYVLFNDSKHGDELMGKLKPIAGKDTKLIPQKLDFTNIGNVKDFINDFINSKKDLHVLINCSSMVSMTPEKDEYGTNRTFLVNVISPYLFITRFTEYLSTTTDPTFKKRIINCTCGNILTVNVRPFDIELKKIQYKPLYHYSHEKKQHSIYINFLSTKYPNLFFANVIPGWVQSANSNIIMPDMAKSLMSDLRTPEQGADTVLWAALSEEALTFKSGEVFLDRSNYKLSYMNQPNFIKNPGITMYLKSLQTVLNIYENPKPLEKTEPKGNTTEKTEEAEIKKES